MGQQGAGPSTPERTVAQRVLQRLARLVADVYYRRIDVVGTAPVPGRAAILAVNHTNGLGDAVVVLARTATFPGFLAAATWWKFAPARWLFDLVGVLPVHRRREGEDTRQNTASFDACARALAGGAQIAIHPEGEMHDGLALLPLKTGAARIALAAAEGDVPDLVIVPYAVVYEDRSRFRSEAGLALGRAIRVADWVDAYRREPEPAVRGLTDAIAAGLRAVTSNHETARGARVIADAALLTRCATDETAERLEGFGPRHELMCRLAAAVEAGGGESGSAFAQLAAAVDTHRVHLDALGVSPEDDPPFLDPVSEPEHRRCTRQLAALSPPAMIGALLNAPVAGSLTIAARAVRGASWRATTLGSIGVVLAPAVWAAETWAARRLAGRRVAVAVAVMAPLGGWALIGWLDRARRLRAVVWNDGNARDQSELAAARTTRADVRDVVDGLLATAGPGDDDAADMALALGVPRS